MAFLLGGLAAAVYIGLEVSNAIDSAMGGIHDMYKSIENSCTDLIKDHEREGVEKEKEAYHERVEAIKARHGL